ncbi:MAG TPA: alpha-glucan family phosphorylase [Amycolatopsis sp.]|nr:alpha-glucan family phosphorylase [Amycolatopsis sp.]
MRAIRRFTVRESLPEPLAGLRALATNLRWTWHPPTRDLFASMDAELFRRVRDPLRMLLDVAPTRLEELAGDEDFLARAHAMTEDLDRYLTEDRWYQEHDGAAGAPKAIAYFSMEFGVHEALPNYSGGLGVLAGDHLKAASDLGVPVIGVGPLYRSGYFRQGLSLDGWQVEHYPVIDPSALPLELLTGDNSEPLVVQVAMPGGRDLHAQVWLARVGRVPLLLLDADIEANDEDLRGVTDRLYGGDADHRIRQEILAGIGGMRAVRRYCEQIGHPQPEVFHTNEGHAGFLGLERAQEIIGEQGLGFDEALSSVRAGTVFTTHTPVPAGLDRFPAELVHRYFGDGRLLPGLEPRRILALGAEDNPGMFNMAHMGLRLAQRANGVSQLHGRVSRRIFARLWEGFDEDEVPITSVTNGVHGPTWVARELTAVLGGKHKAWGHRGQLPSGQGVTDEELWAVRRDLRQKLVAEVRRRVRDAWLQRGASGLELGWVDGVFDPDVLTLGFARRVPTYKRLTLMLRDPERLRALLLDSDRPIQIVVAGKSHPADEGGKALIQQIVRFTDDPAIRRHMVFLPDYDMSMARYLYRGCDVWLNNPTRPLEACGTSGMKSALNGGLNVSIRDGWWDECYDGSNGWAIPTADGIRDPLRRDELEAAALYDLLGQQVAPLFYDRDDSGVPRGWMSMVWHTLDTLGPRVQASRMVREYVESCYHPAARTVAAAARNSYEGARALADYRKRVDMLWSKVNILDTELTVDTSETMVVGKEVRVRAHVDLAGLDPSEVDVQAVVGRVGDTDDLHGPIAVPMESTGIGEFTAVLRLPHAGTLGYTVRVLPRHALLATPAELGKIVLAH